MFQVRPGDVLIVGSDGLWDNLSTKQILEEVCTTSNLPDMALPLLPAAVVAISFWLHFLSIPDALLSLR